MSWRYTEWASRLRVPASFGLAVVYFVFARPTPTRLVAGAMLALIGLALRASSAGRLQKNRQLATSGPYAYTRNPLYLGSALAGLGFAIAGGRWWFVLLLALFFGLVYIPVMRREEGHLRSLFGDFYAEYARAVPLLLPRLTPWRAPAGVPQPFDVQLYRSNREYEALLAFVVIVLALCGKMLWS